MQSKVFLKQDNLHREVVGQGVSRQILGYDNNLMLVRVNFEAGSIGYIHQHKHVQSSYIVSGKFEVEIDGEIEILSAGEAFFVEADRPHGVRCLEAGTLIDAFNPARADFIE